MTEESEWPDEVTADEPELNWKLKTTPHNPAMITQEIIHLRRSQLFPNLMTKKKTNQLRTRRTNLLMSRKNRVLQMIWSSHPAS